MKEQDVAYHAGMKANELREIAKGMGLTFPFGTTKEAMLKAMDEAAAANRAQEAEDLTGVDDAPPVIDPAQAVV